ncbi:MAG TPA: glutaminyl-peptide cyclotransferase [Steroidobacteraceae bacterium]|nr:glutaminyl-peptide cyclotransferase [Steroidobacteraceae bacterium]
MRTVNIALALWAALWPIVSRAAVPVYGYEIVRSFPHDRTAFTEGLFYLDGYLYESTGLNAHSTIRKERLESGEVLEERRIPPQYFGEGIVNWKSHLISLTWKSHVGFVRDLNTFKTQRQFSYDGEGWALTQDGTQIYMSDGTADVRVLNPQTLRPTRLIHVSLDGRPTPNLNELEWVDGEIYANVWQTNFILRIDPHDGRVVGVINLAGLLDPSEVVPGETDVLNGIAYDRVGHRLFVTGKNWPKLFQIKLRLVGTTHTP